MHAVSQATTRSLPALGESLPSETLIRAWPTVQVTDAMLSRGVSCGDSRMRVSVTVHLAALLPVDVKVELQPPEPSTHHFERTLAHRLWSVHSFGNGSYLFEGCVPAADLERFNGCAIVVTPVPHHIEASALAPVIGWLAPFRAVAVDRLPAAPAMTAATGAR